MLRITSIALLASVLSFLAACSDGSDSSRAQPLPPLGVEVTLTSGPVIGQDSERVSAWEWLGVPFAAPPTGELRWKAPRPAVEWMENRQAQAFAPACPQIDFFGGYIGEEDCLYLNIWRPRTQERNLPVFLWIHGGSNRWGAADWPVYHGARLAKQANIVVVTIQYRLGPLGWLYYPPLQDGDANDNSGNFGTLDIIASLQWVQDSVELFGGDPENVTAGGESAGGADVLAMMLSEQEGQTPQSFSNAETAGYLRGKTAEEIIQANPGMPTNLGDGHVLPVAGADLFDSGNFPGKVPLLIGTNKDEYKLYTNPVGYNALPDASPELRDAVGRYRSDLWRVNGADSIATRLRALDDFPDIYVYRFNWGSPDADGNSPLPYPFGPTGGAHHGAELPFMFGNWDSFLIDEYKDLLYNEDNRESRKTMASVMVDYWGSFIRQGDPNGGSLPPWSPWSNAEGEPKAIVLDVNYADNQPAIGEDFAVWTVETVFEAVQANVSEPLLSELMPYLDGSSGDQ